MTMAEPEAGAASDRTPVEMQGRIRLPPAPDQDRTMGESDLRLASRSVPTGARAW
jgi:hypothetical protein